MKKPIHDIVGIIPMAGQATRLGKLPFSKELYPIITNDDAPPKPVSTFLIERMRQAGVSNYHMVLRNGKCDIPTYFGSGKNFDIDICYHMAEYGYGVPFTINQAYPFIKGKTVALGFPDIIFEPRNAFSLLLKKLCDQKISVVLGSLPVKNPEKWDIVGVDKDGSVSRILIKPQKLKGIKFNWFIAAWKPDFTDFLNSYVETLLANKLQSQLERNECQLSNVLNKAIQKGFNIKQLVFNSGKCLDIGTREGLIQTNSFFG